MDSPGFGSGGVGAGFARAWRRRKSLEKQELPFPMDFRGGALIHLEVAGNSWAGIGRAGRKLG